MAEHALGDVTSASTTVAARATLNRPTLHGKPATDAYACQAIQFQVLETNTSSVYIVDRQNPNLSLNVHAQVPAPSTGPPQTLPAWTIGNPASTGAFNLADFWILPKVAGEGVRVTAVRT